MACLRGDVCLTVGTGLIVSSNCSFLVYDTRKDPDAPENLIILQGEGHTRRRRLWNRGLTPEALREYEALIAKRASQVVSRIQENKGSIDLASLVNYFT